MKLLFICGRNRSRSPTAESLFRGLEGMQTCSAGLNPDADEPLTSDLIEWADLIFVMVSRQRARMSRVFGRSLRGKRVVCLHIPDDFDAMDPELVRLLWERVPRSVPALAPFRPTQSG